MLVFLILRGTILGSIWKYLKQTLEIRKLHQLSLDVFNILQLLMIVAFNHVDAAA